jgi:hypothetical protein
MQADFAQEPGNRHVVLAEHDQHHHQCRAKKRDGHRFHKGLGRSSDLDTLSADWN